MSRNPKILVIRLSSIGDIVLTTPVIRCLKLQLNAEVDFLTKKKYREILISNPNVSRVLVFEEISKGELLAHNYNYVIDLQNNFRSFMLRLFLPFKSYAFPKNNFKRLLLIYFGKVLSMDTFFNFIFGLIKNSLDLILFSIFCLSVLKANSP